MIANGRSGHLGRVVAGAALCSVLAADVALAHGGRMPLEQWGGFPSDVTRCQRVVAAATAMCAARAWVARDRCLATELSGGGCDTGGADAEVQAGRRDALDLCDAACSERQAGLLGYLGMFDLQADVIKFCRAWEAAAVSAGYGPVSDGGTVPPGSAETHACVDGASQAITRIMRFVFATRRRTMDWIAGKVLTLGDKQVLLGRAERRIARARALLAERMTTRCPESRFEALYGRGTLEFLAAVAARADCIGAQPYIQDGVLCPDPVCGNGIVEPGEDCDDGNRSDGDGCPAGCLR